MCGWREWHFPDEFDGFPELRFLEIRSCPVLRGSLPAHLPALEKLKIVECEELACPLPWAPKLHQLLVEGSSRSFTGVPPHNIVISGTQLANSVLEWLQHIQPPRVQSLRIIDCDSAISISADYLPASLQYLEISDCSKLTFSEQMQHKSLTEIEVVGCGSLTLFPMAGFPNLKELRISKCQSMEKLNVEVPQALPNLPHLRISDCPSLVSLPSLGLAAPHLQSATPTEDCRKIDCFAEEYLPLSLKTLAVIECEKLAIWITSNVLQSENLTHLKLASCFDIKSFPGEGCLPASLESLKLFNFPNLETLDCKGLHHLTSLKTLAIADCEKLENITEKHWLASIENIYIGEECPLRRKLEEMEHPPIQFIPYADVVDFTYPRYYSAYAHDSDYFPDTDPATTCSVQ